MLNVSSASAWKEEAMKRQERKMILKAIFAIVESERLVYGVCLASELLGFEFMRKEIHLKIFRMQRIHRNDIEWMIEVFKTTYYVLGLKICQDTGRSC